MRRSTPMNVPKPSVTMPARISDRPTARWRPTRSRSTSQATSAVENGKAPGISTPACATGANTNAEKANSAKPQPAVSATTSARCQLMPSAAANGWVRNRHSSTGSMIAAATAKRSAARSLGSRLRLPALAREIRMKPDQIPTVAIAQATPIAKSRR